MGNELYGAMMPAVEQIKSAALYIPLYLATSLCPSQHHDQYRTPRHVVSSHTKDCHHRTDLTSVSIK